MSESKEYRIRIKELPLEGRPRERLSIFGPEALSDAELLAIILGSGTKNLSAIDLAHQILKEVNGIKGLDRKSFNELARFHGVGKAKAAQIIAAFELSRRIVSYQDKKIKLKSPQDVANYLFPRLRSLNKEHFGILILDSKNKLKKDICISIGDLNSSVVHPREIFHEAILELASSIILYHNHPSGEPEPSDIDKQLTSKIVQAGKILSIDVLDHVIIGDESYFSFKENGLI
ncbi:DNA repair protein RadC [Candidatus Aminicenantes bacterium AC-708-M15]|jgi:DNA repair protein RadC|nr:DNA repair protein RadC [SCandidatus Aminicenantes bacterium Aminicenantia_JdfR_composite]MCP2596953.1 DNA repair protein RadC [Candidatus Aminicenantes bacterium AC-335-G13]MCP2603969.1 DNA repair protein RadC [Candidatus Aminicenantes bacterium AC-708-M15]